MKTSNQKLAYVKDRTARFFSEPIFYRTNRHKEITTCIPEYDEYIKAKNKISREKRDMSIGGDSVFVDYSYQEPLLTAAQEKHLFRKYNFYKFMALKSFINVSNIDISYNYILKADDVRNSLLLSNVRLGINFAAKSNKDNFEEALSEYNDVLMKVIDYFDYRKDNGNGGTIKFSTYATWCLKNQYYKITTEAKKRQRMNYNNIEIDEHFAKDLSYEREQIQIGYAKFIKEVIKIPRLRESGILRRRYGIDTDALTLEVLGAATGVCKERIRQLESKALERIQLKLPEVKKLFSEYCFAEDIYD